MVAVTITVTGPGSVRAAGSDCRSTCGMTVPRGTSFHTEAAPDPGARFSGWSGACTGTGACDFVAAGDVTVGAAFADIPAAQRVKLSVDVSGSGRVTSTPAAIACPGTCSAAFDVGSAVQLTATADSGFAFAGWSGACSGSGACAFSIGKDETVRVTFTKVVPTQRTLSIALSGDGTVTSAPAGISCPGTCSASFGDGASVTLTASASAGSTFSGWSGACPGQVTCSVTMTADQNVGASFAPTAAVSLTISPLAASITSGATQRFTATVSGSADMAVAWSVAEGAAGGSIDPAGLYTAPQASGTFHVVAASHADPSRTATAAVTVSKSTSAAISSCTPITAPGTFAVTADLSSPGTCLDVHDTHGVTIDCGGHTVGGSPALSMTNVDGFSLTNCNFASTSTIFVANLTKVSNGTFQHDTFGTTWVNVVRAADVRIDQNTFNASYQQSYSHRVVLSSNTLISQTRGSASTAAMIISNAGSDNQIVGNVMDGKWAGSGFTETDDGVLLTDESGDTVSGNTISNVFDCGIETGGVIANATISNNRITRTGICGIGGWYWNSLRASTVSGNVASDVPRLFHFYRIFGLRPAGFDGQHELPADAAVYFSDNAFDGNRLVNPSAPGSSSSILRVYNQLDYSGTISSGPGERAPGPSDFVLTNNTFRNNDFGHALTAPDFGTPIVSGLVIDGGGNVCSNNGAAYPLVCH